MTAPAAPPKPEHSAPGGPVYATGLRPRDKVRRSPCGCASDDTRHIAFCQIQHDEYAAHRSRLFAAREAGTIGRDPLLT